MAILQQSQRKYTRCGEEFPGDAKKMTRPMSDVPKRKRLSFSIVPLRKVQGFSIYPNYRESLPSNKWRAS
jgi:hypothetical protein